MNLNQNETGVKNRNPNAECRIARSSFVIRDSSFPHAFTLTELLVVITIIAVLAGLITGAAVNALNKAKQASITLEIQQLSSAFEDFKNEYGAYPPNVFLASTLNATEQTQNGTTLLRLLKKSFSRSTEFGTSLPATNNSSNNVTTFLENGLSPAEALVFWLQGFSQDIARPLSGTDLTATTIEYTNPVTGAVETPSNVVTIETRQSRYDFDRGRLRISFDPTTGNRRFLVVQRTTAPNVNIQIQLYEYLAPSSQEPFIYFDTSRETPEQVVNNWTTTEFFYSSPTSGGSIFPIKQMRANAPSAASTLEFVEYVNAKKFQILHCGLDDAWGDFFVSQATLNVPPTSSTAPFGVLTANTNYIPQLLFPTGPFIGDIADTVGNFGTGTLEDAQE